jgi:hypothetical protein
MGDIVRIIFIPILILSIRIKRRDLFWVAIPYLLLILATGQFYWLDNDFVSNISMVAKLSLPILIFLFIKNNTYLRANPEVIQKVIYINTAVLLVNIFLSYFGIGFSNYTGAQNFGGTGFFYAGNEVAGLLLVMYAIVLFQFRQELRKSLLISLIFFIAGIGLASKSALFGVLIIFGLFIYCYEEVSKYMVATFVASTTILIYEFFYSYIALAINRWDFFINKDGALIYITGGIKRWTAIGDYFTELQAHPLLILTGYGWQGVAEANFIDLMQAYGVLGILTYFIWVYWGANLYKKMPNRKDKIYTMLIVFLVISVATLVGHIMQSAMIAPFIAILANSDIFNRYEETVSFN